MSLSCARHSRLSLCLCSFRFSSFFRENFVVTQPTSAGVFHHSKNSQGADPRNEHRAHLKGTFSKWVPRGNQLKTLTKHIFCCPFFRFLPGLAFLPVCVCFFLCRGLGSPCLPGVCSVCGLVFPCLSLVAFGVRFSLWAPSRRPAFFFKVFPWLRITAHAVWDCQGTAASSGTSDRCSCRNFGTSIITLMLPLFQYVVIDRSGTSVRSTSWRRGAKPLAVAAAVKQCRRRRCGVPAAVCCGSGNLQMNLFASVVWFGRKAADCLRLSYGCSEARVCLQLRQGFCFTSPCF